MDLLGIVRASLMIGLRIRTGAEYEHRQRNGSHERGRNTVRSVPAPGGASHCGAPRRTAWPENMQLCTPAILYVTNMYVFRTIVLAAVVGRPAYQFIDAVYVRD